MRESDILYQRGAYWAGRNNGQLTVYRDGATVARADSSYEDSADGESLARARVEYLYGRYRADGRMRTR